ncbi:iron ABC transporter permease [Lactiplantibacillus sp. WILCCON 0030]|uniref:Iron ABC transporter permease n=1 Tax=Lactiplantibacillus brownii TaxID=3069269 RepID=A0ABU1A792_9LACO|nr:iron ABC transporter permease [Lactiplantibacillus brownii]MDQ7936733.1 iron ABC transporter permease [Lactiplantibacillus brownii]
MTNRRIWTWSASLFAGLLALLIAGPLVALIGQTLFGSQPAELLHRLTTPAIMTSLRHSLLLGAGTIIGTTLIATPLAFVMARTKLGQVAWLHWLLLVPFMTPPYINAMGWIYFFQPHGLLAQVFPNSAFSFKGLFSPFGIILIMSLHLYPFAYLLLRNALAQFNQRWTQAALVHGVSRFRILTRVTLPILLVPYLAMWVLVFTKTLAEFGTPATLGRNAHFEVLTTTIQKDLSQWPLDFKGGVLAGTILLSLALLAWVAQQTLLKQPKIQMAHNHRPIINQHWAVTLGASLFVGSLLLVAIGIPYLSIIFQSLLKQRSAGLAIGNWTAEHYLNLLRFDSPAFKALLNTFGLAIVISVFNLVIGTLISVGSLTKRFPKWLRQSLHLLGALPLAIPNVVLALSLMIFFSQLFAFTKLYGTITVLIIADIILFLPTTVQYMTTALQEFNDNFLNSARIFEARPSRIFLKIIVPVLMPALINSFAMSFIATSRELVVALLLLPSGLTTISSFIYQSFEQGEASQGMALAVITVLMTFIVLSVSNSLLDKQLNSKH